MGARRQAPPSALSLMWSPSGARSSSGCATTGSSRSRTSSPGGPRSRPCTPPTTGSRPARRPTPPTASRGGSPPGAGTARRRSSTSSTAAAGSSSTRAPTCSASDAHERLIGLDLGDFIGVDGVGFKTRRGELSLQVDRLDAAREEPAAAARQVPRPRGHRAPLPPPRARPDRQPRGPRAVPQARRDDHGGARVARRRGLRRGRDAGAAAALRRRAGAAVHHPPQRARPRPLPADRDRALPEAAASSAGSTASTSSARTSATRAISFKHNPEFTMLEWYEAYADYNDAAVRLETLVAGRRRARQLGTTRSSATGARSTSRRRGAG